MIDPNIMQDYLARYQDRPDIMQTLTSTAHGAHRDADHLFQEALKASENYYLLYYTLFQLLPVPHR